MRESFWDVLSKTFDNPIDEVQVSVGIQESAALPFVPLLQPAYQEEAVWDTTDDSIDSPACFEVLCSTQEAVWTNIDDTIEDEAVDHELACWLQKRRQEIQKLPDISLGLGKKQENLDLVELESYVLREYRLMVYQEELCEYQEPCWRKLDARRCTIRLRQLFQRHHLDNCLTMKEYSEIHRLLLANPSIQHEGELTLPNHSINLFDGRLDIKDMCLRPSDPADGYFTYLPLTSDEIFSATEGPIFERFMQDVSAGDPDVRRQVLEMIGLALTGYEAKVFFAILGPSNSGKTQIIRFLTELLGHENVASIAGIHELGSKFAMSALDGKRVALCADLPDDVLPAAAVGALKQAVSSDSLKIEAKYKNPKTVYQRPLYVFAGNHPIRVPNMAKEQALLNRLIVIPFSYAPPPEKQTQQLYKLLLRESAYIVGQSILAYRDLIQRNFVVTRSLVPPEYAPEEGKAQILDVDAFISSFCVLDENSEISTAQLYQAYQNTVSHCNILSSIEFARTLSDVLSRYSSVTALKRVHGQDIRGYKGIRLR